MNGSEKVSGPSRHALVALAALLLFGGIRLTHADQQPDQPAIKPFRIAVDEAVLRDLKERLARTRWPDQLEGAGWDYGVELGYLKELVTYWRDRYDWRAQERKLNQFDQFVTTLDGLKVHFIHMRSKEKTAL